MTPEQQRIAIAEACGWRNIKGFSLGLFGKRDNDDGWLQIPNYLSDLNAMHEAEKALTDTVFEDRYMSALLAVTTRDGLYPYYIRRSHQSSTASQRAEAFLVALHLWTE